MRSRRDFLNSGLRVCVSRIISEPAPRIFSKLGTKLGVKNVRNVAWTLFLDFCPFSRKPLIYAKKTPFLAIFGSFWDFAGNPFREFP